MFKKETTAIVSLLFVFSWSGMGLTAELKDNWGDFLHYAKIGRIDLARTYAQAILEDSVDPMALLGLVEESPQDYQFLLWIREAQSDSELSSMTNQVLVLVEKGRQIRRADAKVILDEVNRLMTSTERERTAAIGRLRDSGEYAIPFLLDALANSGRKEQLDRIHEALLQIGTPAIRPLGTAIQAANANIRVEVVRALGQMASPECLPYLKYVVEYEKSEEIRQVAVLGIHRIDPQAMSRSSADLFFRLAESYYYRTNPPDAISTAGGVASIWLWDDSQQRPVRKTVDSRLFHELMAMRYCEWALRADNSYRLATGLWVAGLLKARAAGIPMPDFFGDGHVDAVLYIVTAGPEYLHQVLARAVRDKDTAVTLLAIEALMVTAGEKSIFTPIGSIQPLLQALTSQDRTVRTVAAIAVATAGPRGRLTENQVVMENLAKAVALSLEPNGPTDLMTKNYALRSLTAMLRLAEQRKTGFDLSIAHAALVRAAQSSPTELKSLAIRVLAYCEESGAQQTLAEMALKGENSRDVRIEAFGSLATSAKLHGSLLADQVLNAVYDLIRSKETEPQLRVAAATAYGALNLLNCRMQDLILDQARK